ncbi:MAG: SGNH/GDSL hydrolase family protein, partial [Verrucomicrobiae bacterium]|nr:SGNH/GDSL hydrolase family protein [Verrucomicrobiae bacterium]
TNMLGNGERLIQWIRERFPDAPPIAYEKHVGSAVEYDFTRGWMRQHVLGKQPDLVILYSGGKAADLEKLLADFRAHSTADVIVASLHLREQDKEITDATVNLPEWDAIRDVALKYGCEWVDSRREWAAYLQAQGKPIDWLLKDAVHQNDHGALVINENICRHLVPGGAKPSSTERLLEPGKSADSESVSGRLGAGETMTVNFRGNRIDVVARRIKGGGKLVAGAMILDGRPLDEVAAFLTTVILPGKDNHKPERGSAADHSPHQIILANPATILPQRWTIRMYGDAGAYQLIGSVTGPDGYGHNGMDFTGNSGQITVPTDLWRRRLEADGETYSNRDGDTFSWEVYRATASEVDFGGDDGEVYTEVLADQLKNGWHTLELGPLTAGAGEIIGFRVHEPAFR